MPFNNSYLHSAEGLDDMPAHIKSSLTNTNLTLSILDNKLNLGTWQEYYLNIELLINIETHLHFI